MARKNAELLVRLGLDAPLRRRHLTDGKDVSPNRRLPRISGMVRCERGRKNRLFHLRARALHYGELIGIGRRKLEIRDTNVVPSYAAIARLTLPVKH